MCEQCSITKKWCTSYSKLICIFVGIKNEIAKVKRDMDKEKQKEKAVYAKMFAS